MRWAATGLSVVTFTAFLGSAVSAQVIYTPPVTQFCAANPYDYAGDLPFVSTYAAYPSLPGASYGRHDGFAFTSSRRLVVERGRRAFADHLGPHGNPITDITSADVTNAAYARLPRYFIKSLALQQIAQDQSASNDANAPTSRPGSIVIITRRGPGMQPATRPTN